MCTPIRTLICGPGHDSLSRPSWARIAAVRAALGVGNAAENESPAVEKTYPSSSMMQPSRIRSWDARLAAIPSRSVSQSLVDPTTSLNRKETVPLGLELTTRGYRPGYRARAKDRV